MFPVLVLQEYFEQPSTMRTPQHTKALAAIQKLREAADALEAWVLQLPPAQTERAGPA
jgi:hypothetical protein